MSGDAGDRPRAGTSTPRGTRNLGSTPLMPFYRHLTGPESPPNMSKLTRIIQRMRPPPTSMKDCVTDSDIHRSDPETTGNQQMMKAASVAPILCRHPTGSSKAGEASVETNATQLLEAADKVSVD